MFKKALLKTAYFIFVLSALLAAGCGGDKKSPAASMEQLHAENGFPVGIRQLSVEDFSVSLKYPALISSSSESTARSALDDVVRSVSVKVGQTVKQGDVVVSFSADNRTLQQAALAHENARTAFNRASALFKSNDISRQDFDSVRMQYELSLTNLKAANDMVYVKAPISGTVAQINVHVTENARTGMPLFTVSNNGAFEARLHVGADEIDRIKVGARAFIDPPKAKQDGRVIEGRVTQVSLIMDSQKQAFPVTVSFDGTNSRLVSGLNVDILVETYRNEKAIVLSRQELVRTETGTAVFTVDDYGESSGERSSTTPRLRKSQVQTGEERGLRVEITGGLKEGDFIVSEGAQNLRGGTSGTAEDAKINVVSALIPRQ